jgi:phosphotransferase system enzyme I (PtsI)
MASLAGLGVSPGIVIGPAHVIETGMASVPEFHVAARAVDEEAERFQQAVVKSRRQVKRLQNRAAGLGDSAAEELGFLLEAHMHMLTGSRLVRGVAERIRADRINAEWAVQAEISEISRSFAEVGDPYLAARVQDIRDVGTRLVRNLTAAPFHAFANLPRGAIVIADEITPADTAMMDPDTVGGFATQSGGAEGHTAIMARSLGLPAVLGVGAVTQQVATGDTVIIDGVAGVVVVNPDARTRAQYDRRRHDLAREQRQLARLKRLPAESRDGVTVALQANVELPVELKSALEVGASGVGLLRSEFIYMNRDDLPGEDEQYDALCGVIDAMDGRPVTVRTLDLGGEKLATALQEPFADSVNPALGLRAIRLSLKIPLLLETQLAAILRAGARGPVRILLPMISSTVEIRQVRQVMDKVVRRLRRRHVKIADPLPPLGIMIEVPGAALAADGLATVADFFSIGTNDLIQYTLAIDRGDEQVAGLYDPLHPAVLRLIQFTTEAALRRRIPVNLCGEMAGDPRYTALLLGLGLRDLSMTPASVLRVKKRIRSLAIQEATQRTQHIMDQWDSGRIATMLDDFNALA